MSDEGTAPPADELQFDRADFKAPQETLSCRSCSIPIRDAYYTANTVVLCPACRTALGDGRRPVTFALFAKATWFGFLAAVAGAVIWGGITKLTGYNIGFVAVVVGILIGNAVRKNGGGQGGWVFQAIAIVMTYVCIALSLAPDILTETAKHLDSSKTFSFSLIFAFLVLSGPVLASFTSIFGFLINGFAFYQAWKVNRRAPMVIAGPLHVSAGYAPSSGYEVAAGG